MRLTRKAVAGIGAAAAIAVGGVAVAMPAIASTNATGTSSSSATPTPAKKADHHRDRLRAHELKVAAQTIGISTKELRDQLRAGKSLKEVAAAHHVSESTLVTALEKGLDPYVQRLVDHKRGQKPARSHSTPAPSATTS